MKLVRVRRPEVGIAAVLLATVALTAVLAPMEHRIGLLNAGLLFLLLTLSVSAFWGWRIGVVAAIVANLALNFFFVPPLHQFTVQALSNVIALVVFLVVSVIGGSLLSTAQAAAAEARRRAAETRVLLDLSRAMVGQREPVDALTALCNEVVIALNAPGASVLSGSGAQWYIHASAGSSNSARAPDSEERVMAEQALATGQIARLGHTGLSAGRRPRIVQPAGTRRVEEMRPGVAFVPLRIGDRTLGVLRVDGPIGASPFREQPDGLLTAFAGEAAQGVQRAELTQAAAHAEALMEADELKAALMASISHDLKTPLAGIKTSVSNLLDAEITWSDDDLRAFLETIDSQADRLNRVISDILDLNRIESGVVRPKLEPLEAGALFREAAARASLLTGSRVVTIDTDPSVRLVADESLLVQAIVNLVENAAKYSTPGSAIHLEALTDGDHVRLVVEDEGPGIAARDLPYVFDRFYRAAETSRRVKGSGLGLAIVKGFVSLSGGTASVESSPAGTRFIVTLPAARHAATQR